MFDEIDGALKGLLAQEMFEVRDGRIELSFEQPKREWVQRLTKPTLNFYLYDVRENARLRPMPLTQALREVRRGPQGETSVSRAPLRVNLHYMITAWATDPEDEHRMLWGTMLALFKHLCLPDDLMPEAMRELDVPVTMQIAQDEMLPKPTELWGVLNNEVHPAVGCLVTVPMNPFVPVPVLLVSETSYRFSPTNIPGSVPDRRYDVTGRLFGKNPKRLKDKHPKLRWVQRDIQIEVNDESGEFVVRHVYVAEGKQHTLTLELSADDIKPIRFDIVVPKPEPPPSDKKGRDDKGADKDSSDETIKQTHPTYEINLDELKK